MLFVQLFLGKPREVIEELNKKKYFQNIPSGTEGIEDITKLFDYLEAMN